MPPVRMSDVPLEMLYEQAIFPPMKQMVGKRYRIAHLTSERGMTLNGKTCQVRGYDRTYRQVPRLHCFIEGNNDNDNTGEDAKEMVRLKMANLVPVEAGLALETFMQESSPISDQTLRACLEMALVKHDIASEREEVRRDLAHRVGLYEALLGKLKDSSCQPLADADYCFPCGGGKEQLGNDNNFGRVMQLTKPGCYGNEICDMRYMDIGLKGDGATECSVCHEVLEKPSNGEDAAVIVTLPCLHIFHEGCIKSWLGSELGQRNWNCPSCRKTVPLGISMYCVNYEEQLLRRIDEYPLSGFCTKCQIMIMENQRHESLPM